jgi:hypothetical protein
MKRKKNIVFMNFKKCPRCECVEKRDPETTNNRSRVFYCEKKHCPISLSHENKHYKAYQCDSFVIRR